MSESESIPQFSDKTEIRFVDAPCPFCNGIGATGGGTVKASVPELQQYGIVRCHQCGGTGKLPMIESIQP